MLCGVIAVLQAPGLQCVSLDPFPFQQDGLATTEVDIGRRQVVQALIVTVIVVMADEVADLELEMAWQQIVLEQDAVLQGLVPALDLALGLGMVWRSANMLHAVLMKPVGQVGGDVGGAIITEQSELVNDVSLITA